MKLVKRKPTKRQPEREAVLEEAVVEAAKGWLERYETEVRDPSEEAPCKNLVAALDALAAYEHAAPAAHDQRGSAALYDAMGINNNALNEAGWKLLECAGPAIHANRCKDVALEVLIAYINSVQRQATLAPAAQEPAPQNSVEDALKSRIATEPAAAAFTRQDAVQFCKLHRQHTGEQIAYLLEQNATGEDADAPADGEAKNG